MPRFLRLWLYARAFITRYPGFLRLRGSPVFSLALYGIIQAGFMMLRFYTTRSIFAIPPSGQSPVEPGQSQFVPSLSSQALRVMCRWQE
ncbi:hypothetical protein, partial [Paraburkholderia sp. UYCP14C]|uniref:hypothetical protein n=1 Tax=Paraburkholderia sp. UYCP14C TaxID=2511130 RepID=UPI001B7D50FC